MPQNTLFMLFYYIEFLFLHFPIFLLLYVSPKPLLFKFCLDILPLSFLLKLLYPFHALCFASASVVSVFQFILQNVLMPWEIYQLSVRLLIQTIQTLNIRYREGTFIHNFRLVLHYIQAWCLIVYLYRVCIISSDSTMTIFPRGISYYRFRLLRSLWYFYFCIHSELS